MSNITSFRAMTLFGGTAQTTVEVANIQGPKTIDEFGCRHGALMGTLGLFVQGLLAFLAFTSLIAKRYCEPKKSRRPWRIWFFDTSKQAFGAMVIHFANVFLADAFQGDPCTWYVINFLLDSTIGLFVVYIGLKVAQWIVIRKGWESLKFGEYGDPPQCNTWAGQCALYILVMVFEKIVITLLVQFSFWDKVRDVILSPIKDPHLELIIVMFVVPLIVNAIMFWVIDNFLMMKKLKLKAFSTPVDSPGASVRYFSASNRVKYYDKPERADNSDSDEPLDLQDDSSDTEIRMNGSPLRDRHHSESLETNRLI